jgi:hypothetical protein
MPIIFRLIFRILKEPSNKVVDEAASMAAQTIREYLEHGTIRHSVNFPNTNLPELHDRVIRISVVNKNIPGMLSKIMKCLGRAGLNIVNKSINPGVTLHTMSLIWFRRYMNKENGSC